MSVRNRYEMVRRYYDNCVILILIKRKLYIYRNNILIDFKEINKLKELHINYLILDNLDILKKEYEDNSYEEYYLKHSLNNILDNFLINFKKGLEEECERKMLLYL